VSLIRAKERTEETKAEQRKLGTKDAFSSSLSSDRPAFSFKTKNVFCKEFHNQRSTTLKWKEPPVDFIS